MKILLRVLQISAALGLFYAMGVSLTDPQNNIMPDVVVVVLACAIIGSYMIEDYLVAKRKKHG